MEMPNESVIKKPKRLTSVVWNHFERVRKADICYAVCVHCNKKLSGSSNSGTTHLRNHLMRCLKRSNYDVSQLLAAKRRRKENTNTLSIANISFDEGQRKDENINSSALKFEQEPKKDETINLGSIKFDQEQSRQDLVHMIILHGYPLAMVEHIGFKVFVKNLQPLFDFLPNGAIELDCMEIYEKQKQKLYEMINKLHGRINVAVDVWTSPENSRYLCLTVHYIDRDWKLHKKILNFVTLDPSHTEETLSEVVIKCLMDWDVDYKLFSLTYDDCFTNDDIVPGIKERISQNRRLLSNGKLFDVPCAARVLRLIVQDAIEALREVAHKIRESIRYAKSSHGTLGKLNEFAQQAGIDCQKSLFLDCPGRWNSTYLMLETALEYKDAFSLLKEHDSAYTTALSDKEWEWASSITGYLKLFVEITNGFAGNKCPTANIYFPEICDVHIQLNDWCKSLDTFMSSMALKMKEKFDKYWSKCSLALAVAAILDPRFKMKLVEYYYTQIYGSSAPDRIKDVFDRVKELFKAYTVCPASVSVDQGSAWPGGAFPGNNNDTRDRLKGFDKFLHETSQSQSIISDLDKYLEEPIFPRNFDFNILNWWKVHTPRYPVLSMMAHDVLGIPMSTVALESVFSAEGRVLDHHRSSLNPDTRQALICAHDWLRVDLEESNLPSSHSAISQFSGTN
ncbi:zinc finger BED domain-containing protein RICESLEEPER 1-like [Malania oleifera]|uniref:zinc finger BED domain-containing protein RICESLEEPER 1-like n=1 Tax=Malania oleifera TaxID=397392 RepID=UPI0025AEB4C9|nr:zinc finger BED domain-containing protein RICESLEEPER 1-like [Malania oleifera]XP_057967039.1 zinc finger BED domain-containing protein RICESLEEPER 1-like [Malania oleifera]XP_057967047.1 zinc finger BED domain-containing protein RICESLEEPER 1-like [Malania oleifera]